MIAIPPISRSNRNLDFTGARFGEWTVIERAPYLRGQSMWLCQCSCGCKKPVSTGNLRNGQTTRCDECRRKRAEINKLRRMQEDPAIRNKRIYWQRLVRNFDVCERWKTFETFDGDINRPTAKQMVIAAIKPDIPLGPDNYQWVGGMSDLILVNGIQHSVTTIAARCGVSRQAIDQKLVKRVRRDGKSKEAAMAEILKEYDFGPKAAGYESPLDKYLDGQIWSLEAGTDFKGEVVRFTNRLRTFAVRKGMKVRIRNVEPKLIVQFYRIAKPAETTPTT